MRKFGLIGKSLSYSFSKNYFNSKFKKEGIHDCQYDLYELESLDGFRKWVMEMDLNGLNVTIPYKLEVLPLLDHLDESAIKVGAANVIKIDEVLTGFNSDYYGFRKSLLGWIDESVSTALILGTGGASRAVTAVLDDLKIDWKKVSRSTGKSDYTYKDLAENTDLMEFGLIINTTPLGTFPEVDSMPPLEYDQISKLHFLYDLVYNPEVTSFMKEGIIRGARTKGGLEMLHLQAEKSWEIWNR